MPGGLEAGELSAASTRCGGRFLATMRAPFEDEPDETNHGGSGT
jgi:hypothetical protein